MCAHSTTPALHELNTVCTLCFRVYLTASGRMPGLRAWSMTADQEVDVLQGNMAATSLDQGQQSETSSLSGESVD